MSPAVYHEIACLARHHLSGLSFKEMVSLFACLLWLITQSHFQGKVLLVQKQVSFRSFPNAMSTDLILPCCVDAFVLGLPTPESGQKSHVRGVWVDLVLFLLFLLQAVALKCSCSRVRVQDLKGCNDPSNLVMVFQKQSVRLLKQSLKL